MIPMHGYKYDLDKFRHQGVVYIDFILIRQHSVTPIFTLTTSDCNLLIRSYSLDYIFIDSPGNFVSTQPPMQARYRHVLMELEEVTAAKQS